MKLTRHNGRAGKNGAYNPKHNDRRFDVANSEHIDVERTRQNIYWDCYTGLSSALTRERGGKNDYSFEKIERIYYYEHTQIMYRRRMSGTKRPGIQSATGRWTICSPTTRPARKKAFTRSVRWRNLFRGNCWRRLQRNFLRRWRKSSAPMSTY